MTNAEKEKVALFKYGVISPMITKTLEYNSVQEGIEILGSKEYINCRLSFCMQPIINNIIKINEESPSNNLTIV